MPAEGPAVGAAVRPDAARAARRPRVATCLQPVGDAAGRCLRAAAHHPLTDAFASVGEGVRCEDAIVIRCVINDICNLTAV